MSQARTLATAFVWKDYSRFVEVAPVERGWLVIWGRYLDAGRDRRLEGNRTYLDLDGVRRRVADAVLELTGDASLVAEAMVRFERTQLPAFLPARPPDPL
jgi:hypothetical protein